jgi:hypothetical protein
VDTGDVVKSATVVIEVANLGLEEDTDVSGASDALERTIRSFIDNSACTDWQNAVQSVETQVHDMDSSVRTKEVAFTVRYRATVRDDGMDDLTDWARRNAWAILLMDDVDIDVEVDVDYDDVTEADDEPDFRVSGGDLDDRLLELHKAVQAANRARAEAEAKLADTEAALDMVQRRLRVEQTALDMVQRQLGVEQESLARALASVSDPDGPDDSPEGMARLVAMLSEGTVPETDTAIADTVHSEMTMDQDHGDA